MDLTSDKKRLMDLVDRAREGRIALPQFQRDFVWDRDSIEELTRSLLRGYYIGSFLFLETDRDHLPFGIRPIAGAKVLPRYDAFCQRDEVSIGRAARTVLQTELRVDGRKASA